jgi:amino acid transporter
VTISFIGVEIIAVTAFEAAKPRELHSPAKNIAWVTLVIYLLSIGGFIANVEWFNQNLPTLLSQPLVNISLPNFDLGHIPVFNKTGLPISAAPVIAAWQVDASTVAGLLTGFLIYSGLSCANVSLYVASRTLYGITRSIDNEDKRWFVRMFAKLNVVTHRTRIPIYSILISAIIFATWLPFVHFSTGFTQEEVRYNIIFPFKEKLGLIRYCSFNNSSFRSEAPGACWYGHLSASPSSAITIGMLAYP